MELKPKLEDYTEDEFRTFLNEFFTNPKKLKGKERQQYIDNLVAHFDLIVNHPEGNGLLFYPPDDREDSPDGVIGEIIRWRKSQGLPLFKDS
ncbi:bacteriocin immunity protein [Escherichia sp. E10V10]|uniref:bacteriocin immunity protein n=1 Tax=unclassified Escherichia TaxID=2608889 RepID=UPI001029B682|nr:MULTISPECIES: bacteriocin immunity protein [unclassified Escherichia]TGB62119.1 bacteriocin immunity protein [Escherichia coli]RZN44652.1 bacteriocin immunity protein [Escherichia sp. E10V10]TGB89152.1 bacteriocin immunity protein [Escherichia sp. E3356]TLI89098.1 bacteriocin immunity protein [Escherichia sp. E4736]TLI90739.1 bacteriocin immunity protein [Escherichia sp. E4694]